MGAGGGDDGLRILHERAQRMSDIIKFPARPIGSDSYINRDAINEACDALEQEVGAIVIGSSEVMDAIDPLAYEINSHLIAIRRALEAVEVGG